MGTIKALNTHTTVKDCCRQTHAYAHRFKTWTLDSQFNIRSTALSCYRLFYANMLLH